MGGSLYYINYTLICILHEGTQLRMGPHLERDMSNIITTYIKMVEKWSYLLSTYVRISFFIMTILTFHACFRFEFWIGPLVVENADFEE